MSEEKEKMELLRELREQLRRPFEGFLVETECPIPLERSQDKYEDENIRVLFEVFVAGYATRINHENFAKSQPVGEA